MCDPIAFIVEKVESVFNLPSRPQVHQFMPSVGKEKKPVSLTHSFIDQLVADDNDLLFNYPYIFHLFSLPSCLENGRDAGDEKVAYADFVVALRYFFIFKDEFHIFYC